MYLPECLYMSSLSHAHMNEWLRIKIRAPKKPILKNTTARIQLQSLVFFTIFSFLKAISTFLRIVKASSEFRFYSQPHKHACILPRPELNTVVLCYISLYALVVALKYRIQSRETHPIGNNWTWIAINLRWSSTWGNGFRSFIVFVISSICSSLFIIISERYIVDYHFIVEMHLLFLILCFAVALCCIYFNKEKHIREYANSLLTKNV